MSTEAQVTDQEVDALLERMRPAVGEANRVQPRDFNAPRRLSQAQVDILLRRVEMVMPDTSAHLSAWLRGPHKTQVASVVEANCSVLIDGLVEPLHVVAFDVGGQLGLLAWDLGAMVAAVECALGSAEPKDASPRALSTVEERILLDITTRVVTLAAGALGVEAKGVRVLREKKALILSEDASTGDSQRIGVHIGLQGAAGESTLRLYFAGVKPPDPPRPAGAPKETSRGTLTTPMSEVDVAVHAELGTAIVPLQELLALEVGDVIVLDTLVGGPVTVAAESRMRARADLGRHDGRLAVRLRSIEKDTRTTWDGK